MSDPANIMVTSTEQWLSDVSEGRVLPVPSGHTALVRNPGIQAFVQAGLIPNELMDIVQQAIARGKAPEMDELVKQDPKRVSAILELVDNVICHCVIEPKVVPVPKDTDGRVRHDLKESGKLYVDMVDPMDKQFIFQWVNGGTHDLKQFRKQYGEAVDVVLAGEDARPAAKRAARPAATKRTGAALKKRSARGKG